MKDSSKSKIFPTINPNSNKMHIAVLMGGMSNERSVSLSTAEGVVNSLKELNYKVTPIDMGRDIAEILIKIKPDIVFNALHAGYGENGAVSGMLDIMGIPYTHSGVFPSAVGIDKIASKALFAANGIKTIEHVIIHKNDDLNNEPMERPYVIKPVSEGSSIGIHLIFPGDNFDIRDYKFEYGDHVIVEKYIKGREIQVAIVGDKAIGALELEYKGRFYDFDAKYNPEKAAKHIMPAPLTEDAYKRVLELAFKAHQAIGCQNISRVEFIYDEHEGDDGEFYILEVNTHPGMTPLSIVPDIAAYHGISYSDLVELLIQDALKK
ncbi:MAG: D-alanine--D-alanine ligase [Alphaproteobacteria bacterium]